MVNSGKHRKKRVPLCAQLVPGEDDDIIAWYNTLPHGGRASAIKNVIRVGLGLPIKEAIATTSELSELVTQNEIRRLEHQLDKWADETIEYLKSEMFKMLSEYGGPTTAPQPVIEENKIDTEKKAKRAKRIQSAKW